MKPMGPLSIFQRTSSLDTGVRESERILVRRASSQNKASWSIWASTQHRTSCLGTQSTFGYLKTTLCGVLASYHTVSSEPFLLCLQRGFLSRPNDISLKTTQGSGSALWLQPRINFPLFFHKPVRKASAIFIIEAISSNRTLVMIRSNGQI